MKVLFDTSAVFTAVVDRLMFAGTLSPGLTHCVIMLDPWHE